ncbi:MAG: glycoside hydrolase family protein, partial [Saprospiraceae bacterium]
VRTAKRADMWRLDDGSVDYFRCIIIETKRREAMGRPGAELRRYKDGREWAIGYGNHIRYLSEYWKRTCKRQGWKVTEAQARAMMYETFHGLCEQVKRDLPNTNRRQQLAVASLAFNWGYGNVKRSGLWRHLKAGRTDNAVSGAWMRTQNATENHRKSRRMEIALWCGNGKAVVSLAEMALSDLRKRGDFKHY